MITINESILTGTFETNEEMYKYIKWLEKYGRIISVEYCTDMDLAGLVRNFEIRLLHCNTKFDMSEVEK